MTIPWLRETSLRDGAAPRHFHRPSAPLAQEGLERRGRLGLADAAIDLGPVVAGRRGEEAHPVLDRATLGISGAVVEPADAGERDCGRAHGAGLERDVEVAVG